MEHKHRTERIINRVQITHDIQDALIYLLVQMCNGMDIEKGMVSCTNAFLFSLALCPARSTPTHQAKHMQLHCSSNDSGDTIIYSVGSYVCQD